MPASTSEDEDELLESLENDTENDPSYAHLREARMQQLASTLKRSKVLRSEGYGIYTQMTDEKALMETTTTTKACIVHFFKTDFNRCRIMDEHLSVLAPAHLETRFLKIDVEHALFLVAKLSIRVLPCVIAFLDGVGVDRIVGFEGLGYSEDTFKTKDLETRLVSAGVLEAGAGIGEDGVNAGGRSAYKRQQDESKEKDDDDDDDWD
ncbi:hypothetical protein ACLMJK_001565 [Lecanora helva]